MKIDPKQYLPHMNKPVKVFTIYGEERNAIYGGFPMAGFLATDCTHPMQNCNLSGIINHWEYVNMEDELDCLFVVNHVHHYFEGQKILDQIQQKYWWQFWK
jgi:hypothetical protein